MKEKTIKLGKQVVDANHQMATQKQIDYIEGLIRKKKSVYFDVKKEGHRLMIKEASKLIDCLIKNIPFTIFDRDERREIKSKRLKKDEEIRLAKMKKKKEERKKMEAIRNAPVKKVEWLPNKPKENDKVRKISYEEQQQKLNSIS